MRIDKVDVIPYRIPNRHPHRIATATLTGLENIVVVLHADSGAVGIGEVVSEPKWNSNLLEGHLGLLKHRLAPAVVGLDPFDVQAVWRAMNRTIDGHYGTKAGIDIALHDLIGRALGLPVWKLLGGAARKVIDVEGPGFGIGFMEPEVAAEMAKEVVGHGCREIEVKCGHPDGPRRDLLTLRAVYEACGSQVTVKVDVTEAYDLRTALAVLPQMAEYGVVWVEQPLPRHHLRDLALLRTRVPVGVMLEESIGDAADLLRAAEHGSLDALHLRLPVLGGFTMSQELAVVCRAVGIGVQVGTSTPSGIGLAAVHHFAATLPQLVRGCHGSPLARVVDDLLRDPLPAFAPYVELNDNPGLGIEVDWTKLEKYRIAP